MRKLLTTLTALFVLNLAHGQTYATLPFSDDLSGGSLGSNWSFSSSQGVGTYAVTDLSGGWPNFGTCNTTTCPNVGATSGNGLIVYNSSAPSGGNNQLNVDLNLNLSGKGTVELSYAVVDWRSGYDSLGIFLSNDGGSNFTYATSVKLWLNPYVDGTWNEVTHDLQALAASSGVSFSSTYVVRFANYLQYEGASTSPKNWPNQSIYYDNFKGIETATLPVDLLYLKGKNEDSGNVLYWATGLEVNNSHFEVQRSLDGTTWQTVGSVEGQGNSQNNTKYNFTDYGFSDGAYYRLKQLDFDGQYKYSNIINIGKEGQKLNVQVRNNGSNPALSITGAENNSSINIYDISGQLIQNSLITVDDAYLDYQLSNLANGTYTLEIISGKYKSVKKITVLK